MIRITRAASPKATVSHNLAQTPKYIGNRPPLELSSANSPIASPRDQLAMSNISRSSSRASFYGQAGRQESRGAQCFCSRAEDECKLDKQSRSNSRAPPGPSSVTQNP